MPSMKVPVTITYLEMTDPVQLRVSAADREDVEVFRIDAPSAELARSLYCDVGRDFHWTDRLVWSDQQWRDYLHRPQLEFWIACVGDVTAGYFELERQPDSAVLIAYFGLKPQFIGQGIGGWLLTSAVRRAWEMQAIRVWLHTCSLDHANALNNYLKRGFQIVRTEPGMQTLFDSQIRD